MRYGDDLSAAAGALDPIDPGRVRVEEATRRVSVQVEDDEDRLMQAMRSLSEARIEIDDISLRQPTLDEVFLTLTGTRPDPASEPEHDAA